MAFQIINDPYYGGGGSGAAFGSALGQSLNQGLSRMLDQQAEQQLYNVGLQRQEQQVQKQVSALAPFLKSQGQGELAELLIRNPQVGIQLLKAQQQKSLYEQEGNLFNLLKNYNAQAEQQPTTTGAVTGIPKNALGSQAPSLNMPNQISSVGAQLQPPLALKPGQALPLANFIKSVEQSNISNALKERQIKQAAEQFEQTHRTKQENVKIKRETEQAEKYLKPKRNAFGHANELSGILNEYEDLLTKDKAWAGPVFGRLGALTTNTARLNQLAQQILTHELLSAQGGGRGSDLLRKVIQGGKIAPTQPIGTQLKYLKKAKEAVTDLIQEEKVIDKIIDQEGYAPANIKTRVEKELKKLKKEEKKGPDVSELPDPNTYKGKGFIDEETGQTVGVVNGQWAFV